MVIPKKKKDTPQDFKALWESADKLLNQMDAAEYKHLVLGMIFLKYISESFVEHQQKILQTVSNPDSDYYVGDDPKDYQKELDDSDHYKQDNVFGVPSKARWKYINSNAKVKEIFKGGQLIDEALVAIENENPSLRGKLD